MIRGDIAAVLKTAKGKDDFIQKLRERKIDAVFRTNDAGRLYGATFIDHRRKEVYNGSALGKEFSANVFHKLFNETQPETGRDEIPGIHKPHLDEAFLFSSPDRGTALEQIFGIFDFTDDGRDYEEEAFQRQMKRRKKKKQQRYL
jgi:hypothetical protein